MSSLLETLSGLYANKPLLGGVIVLGIALFFLWFGIHLQPYYQAMSEWPTTEAEVVRVYENKQTDDDGCAACGYTVHVRFALDGRTHSRAFENLYSEPEIGDTLTVRYNPQSPGEFHLLSNPPHKSEFFYAAFIFGAIALVLIFGGIYESKQP